jgi:AcrR family transcriptional regulator
LDAVITIAVGVIIVALVYGVFKKAIRGKREIMRTLTIKEPHLIEVAKHTREAVIESLRLSEMIAGPHEILTRIQALAEHVAPASELREVTLISGEYEALLNHVWQATVAAREAGLPPDLAPGLVATLTADWLMSLAKGLPVEQWPAPERVADESMRRIKREFEAAS